MLVAGHDPRKQCAGFVGEAQTNNFKERKNNTRTYVRCQEWCDLTESPTFGITKSMKVAVSIPDSVFAQGEALAKRMKLSRSKLYAKALDAFVADNSNDALTAQINAALDKIGHEPDPFVMEAARQTLKRVEW